MTQKLNSLYIPTRRTITCQMRQWLSSTQFTSVICLIAISKVLTCLLISRDLDTTLFKQLWTMTTRTKGIKARGSLFSMTSMRCKGVINNKNRSPSVVEEFTWIYATRVWGSRNQTNTEFRNSRFSTEISRSLNMRIIAQLGLKFNPASIVIQG